MEVQFTLGGVTLCFGLPILILGWLVRTARFPSGRLRRWLESSRAQGFMFGGGTTGVLVGVAFSAWALVEVMGPADVRILSPADGSNVSQETQVDVRTRSLQRDEYVYVLVRPEPMASAQKYWVQEPARPARRLDDNEWSVWPVYIGKPEDQGKIFDICAVISTEKFKPGDGLEKMPDGSSECVRVTRDGGIEEQVTAAVTLTPFPTQEQETIQPELSATPIAPVTVTPTAIPAPLLTPTSTPVPTSIPAPIPTPWIVLEAEQGSGDGENKHRADASGGWTVWLHEEESRALSFELPDAGRYVISVTYSNDNSGALEIISLGIDGSHVGQFSAQDTGDFGEGWNVFRSSGAIGSIYLQSGRHEVIVSIGGGDGFGVEIDFVRLDRSE